MTLTVGRRVRLADDLRLAGRVVPAGEPRADTDPETDPGAGFLVLAAGVEGTVERVDEDRPQSHEVREYERLKSLLDDFGHQMPPAAGGSWRSRWARWNPRGRRTGRGSCG
ncbi:hypothetical protein ACQ86F_05185 [Streptomyces venezuelae ATCC 10712]